MGHTSPLTNSRYPDGGDTPNTSQDIKNAVTDLEDNTVPRFASTALRDNAYNAFVSAGGTMVDGLACFVTGSGFLSYEGGIWGPFDRLPYAQLKQATTQLIPISTWTTLNLDAEALDSDGQHSNTTNNSRFTCVRAGIYQFSGMVPWVQPPGTSIARVGARLQKNGSMIETSGVYVSGQGGSLGIAAVTPSVLVQLAVGDYVELQAFQEFTSTGGGMFTRITTESVSSLSANCITRV